MKRLHLLVLVGLLLAIAATVFLYKVLVLKFPLQPESEISTWTVEASVTFTPTGGSVRAELQLPDNPPGFSVLDESFISRGYGLTTEAQAGQRSAVWTQRRPGGPQTLYYRVQLARQASTQSASDYPGPATPPELAPPLATAAEALLADVRSRSADIDSFSRLLVQEVNRSDPNENVAAFLTRTATSLERAQLLVDLLAGARIPARIVHGFTLADRSQRQEAVPWLLNRTEF
ncbi:UUP1 family membrane protein [Achromobacter denitrificans]